MAEELNAQEEPEEVEWIEVPACPVVDIYALPEQVYIALELRLSRVGREMQDLAGRMSKERDRRFPPASKPSLEDHNREGRQHYLETQQRLREERGERLAKLEARKITRADIAAMANTSVAIDRAFVRNRNPYSRRPVVPPKG